MSIWHWLGVALVGLLMFGGGGRMTSFMGDCAKGIRAFNDGLADPKEKVEKTTIENAGLETAVD